jgi:spore coat polysaccharide biosynthesis protein SpsF
MQNRSSNKPNLHVVAIIQARMGSTRLPGKVLKTVLGKPLIAYQIERLKRCKWIDKLVVATTTKEPDSAIVELCQQLNVDVFRGSESDVLERYYQAACHYQADVVVRLTADCPLIDPEIVDQVIMTYLDHYPKYDYVSNTVKRTYPRGLDTEVFSFNALQTAHQEAGAPHLREHVTPYIYMNSNLFKLGKVLNDTDYSQHRWTVDTLEDFELIKRIIEQLYPINPLFHQEDVINLLREHPEWTLINAHIEQKKILLE